ncbi:hypothetical protein E4U41_005460 [Claviceps citrina]|nr:hypothetical protein E4U41_005460 [Claviceps citrina]
MASKNENLPEVAHGASYPEVIHDLQYQQRSHQQPREACPSPHDSAVDSTHQYSSAKVEDYQSYPQAVATKNGVHGLESPDRGGRRTILGCLPIVFLLSMVIAVLAVLVIGLAAGTGVAANNYKAEQSKYRDLQASWSSLAASKTGSAVAAATGTGGQTVSPDYSKISNGCSDENESTTGTFYSPEFFGKPRFTMYCNKDASNTPFYSLFTADFNGCMSACASWNSYNASSRACEAVSFIPLWSDVATAVKGQAPGDCYLKPGPQSVQKLQTPNIGTECHAAMLSHGESASKG